VSSELFVGFHEEIKMGSGFNLVCDNCQYSVETSGPWEFYRDEKGRRQDFGHPSPVSDEAARRGVYGLFGKLYCSTCNKVVTVILVEFTEPCRDSLKLWSGECEPQEKFLKDDAVVCPKCKSKYLILEPDNDHPPSCQKCGKGLLIGAHSWIS
jgi:hypothetical protein